LNEGSNTTDVADPKASRGLPTEMYDNPARILTEGEVRYFAQRIEYAVLQMKMNPLHSEGAHGKLAGKATENKAWKAVRESASPSTA
jgi:hypothetical protein